MERNKRLDFVTTKTITESISFLVCFYQAQPSQIPWASKDAWHLLIKPGSLWNALSLTIDKLAVNMAHHAAHIYPWWAGFKADIPHYNRPISRIPQCTCPIYHSAPFWNRNVHMRAHFSYKMAHCGIFVWCIVGLVTYMTCGLYNHFSAKYSQKKLYRSPMRTMYGMSFVSSQLIWVRSQRCKIR